MDKALLALIGPWPPPYGGISVHIKRLAHRLAQKGLDFVVYDDTGKHDSENVEPLRGLWVNDFVLRKKHAIIHYHSHSWGNRMRLSAATLKGTRVIFTVHSLRRLPEVPWFKKPEFAHMMAHSLFVAVNPEIERTLKEMGARKTTVISPYIPPEFNRPPAGQVLEFSENHEPVVASSALLFKHWPGASDMYGLFDLVNAFALFKASYPKAGLVIYLSQVGDPELFSRFKELVSRKGLQEDVLIRLNAPEEFHTCLSTARVFVRPTFSDSFGISILEAMDAGVVCVASDAAPRPKQTLIFRAGDPTDMARAIEKAVKTPKPSDSGENAFYALLNLYQKLLGKTL